MEDKKKEILDFIKRRFGATNSEWTNGNCYWFARILQLKFGISDSLDEIVYFPVEGHFCFKLGPFCYDYNGVYESKSPHYSLHYILVEDSVLYSRLMRDCVD